MQTRVVPRWIAMLGYGLALILLLSASHLNWLATVFPLWVLLISVWILFQVRQSSLQTSQSPD
jgi:hypothetical protein